MFAPITLFVHRSDESTGIETMVLTIRDFFSYTIVILSMAY